VTLGGRAIILYPLVHPAAALYTPSMLAILERDVARLPELVATWERGDPARSAPPEMPVSTEPVRPSETRQAVQLGLF
jgi:DNA polymerase